MLTDRYGLPITTTSQAARDAYIAGVDGVLGAGDSDKADLRRAVAARVTKESMRSGLEVPLPEAVLGDLYRFAALEMTEDKTEAHVAWKERRPGVYKNR